MVFPGDTGFGKGIPKTGYEFIEKKGDPFGIVPRPVSMIVMMTGQRYRRDHPYSAEIVQIISRIIANNPNGEDLAFCSGETFLFKRMRTNHGTR